MRFSERYGHQSARSSIQKDELDDGTKNRLISNVVRFYLPAASPTFLDRNGDANFSLLITDFFKNSIDKHTNRADHAIEMMSGWSGKCKWFLILDLIEFCTETLIINDDGYVLFHNECNRILEEEKTAFRLINGIITPIIEKTEIETLDEALNTSDIFEGTKAHLQRALELYSDRERPDYRNSIKESISAIESLSKVLTGNKRATLGQAIKSIEKSQGKKLHPALKDAILKLYGYSSDKGGIRHSLIDNDDVSHSEAKFMLVSCSAFCNYLIELYGVEQ